MSMQSALYKKCSRMYKKSYATEENKYNDGINFSLTMFFKRF